jgi:hypothetical protein
MTKETQGELVERVAIAMQEALDVRPNGNWESVPRAAIAATLEALRDELSKRQGRDEGSQDWAFTARYYVEEFARDNGITLKDPPHEQRDRRKN